MDFFAPVAKLIRDTVDSLQNRQLSFAQAKTILNDLTQSISVLATLLDVDSKQKKELVLQALGYAFDEIWPLIPLPMGLGLMRSLITPAVRAVYLAIADADLELIYRHIVKAGNGAAGNTSNAAPTVHTSNDTKLEGGQ